MARCALSWLRVCVCACACVLADDLRAASGVPQARSSMSPFRCSVSNDLFGDLGVAFDPMGEPILTCVAGCGAERVRAGVRAWS